MIMIYNLFNNTSRTYSSKGLIQLNTHNKPVYEYLWEKYVNI